MRKKMMAAAIVVVGVVAVWVAMYHLVDTPISTVEEAMGLNPSDRVIGKGTWSIDLEIPEREIEEFHKFLESSLLKEEISRMKKSGDLKVYGPGKSQVHNVLETNWGTVTFRKEWN